MAEYKSVREWKKKMKIKIPRTVKSQAAAAYSEITKENQLPRHFFL